MTTATEGTAHVTTATTTSQHARSTGRGRFALDAVALVALVLANNPEATGVPMHEWISLGATIVVAVHLALNWGWAKHALKRLVGRLRLASPVDTVVDVLLFVAFVLAMLSGAMISETLVPLFGLRAAGGELWESIHGPAAYAAIGALALHFALHWRWVLHQIRGIARPVSQARPLEQSGGAA